MGEGFGVTAEHHVDVPQIAIHAHPLRRSNHEVRGRRAFFLRPIFWVGADVDYLFGIAEIIHDPVALVEEVVEIPDDRAEVLARRDRAPAADGMKAHSDGAFGQQRRRLIGYHLVRMTHAENHERRSVLRALAVLTRALAG